MSDGTQGRTFISYSRKDGAEFARDLRETLEKEDLSVWQDLVALEGGEDWWTQIERALRSKDLQHFILVVTAAALASGPVRDEIRLARQEGKSVSPVKGPGVDDLNKLPRWLGHVYDLAIPEQRTALVGKLQREADPRRVTMMAPELPADFVARPMEFGALKIGLLDPQGDSIAGITAALKGAGGYGKTTLAKALARDPDVQDAYFDGILWTELGEKPQRLIATLSDLVETLSGERPQFETINAAAAKLAETLSDRRILMVVDDVWREPDLRPFLQGGRNCVRLVTTRIDSVLPTEALRHKLDAMQGSEAATLLSAGLPPDRVSQERANLANLAARLGEWPLLLKIVNGFLRNRAKDGELLPDAVTGANKRLDAKGLTVFDARDETQRANAVALTIGVSLDLLSEAERERFGELGIFPEDVEIPFGVATRLWTATGGLEDFETEDFLGKLFDLSLLLERNLEQRFFRLHDIVRQFLRDQAGKERLLAQHKALVAILETASDAADERTRRYVYRSLPHHLAEGGERQKLDALLVDPGWLKAKLDATGFAIGLYLDYQQYGASEAQSLIGRTLRLVGGIVGRDGRQLPVQLAARLAGVEAAGLADFARKACALIPRPAIVPLRQSLTRPGAETARLEGHSGGVVAVCLLSDRRLATGAEDETIRLWDTTTGAETARFALKGTSALCALPHGRLAVETFDNTIHLLDLATGAETARLEGHSLCLLPDGRLATRAADQTIRLWDVAGGPETTRGFVFKGTGALCMLPDGRLAAGLRNTIRLLDAVTCAETDRLEGHDGAVITICLLADGRLASGAWDGTIRLWDVAKGVETGVLGHSEGVTTICPLPDGRIASCTMGNVIHLWDVAKCIETGRLEGHTHAVVALCVLRDGRLASGSIDSTVRLWDVARARTTGLRVIPKAVAALCQLPNGHLATSCEDNGIRLWDVETGNPFLRLGGHSGVVSALCLLSDGRLASGSHDRDIYLWNPTTKRRVGKIEGLKGNVVALCLLPDGRLASGSDDNTIRLWDTVTYAETARFHCSVTALCMLTDGRLASGSRDDAVLLFDLTTNVVTGLEGHTGAGALCLMPDGLLCAGYHDGTIRMWNVPTGGETVRLEGHTNAVLALCLLPDGRLASGSRDHTIRIWDVALCAEIVRLELDAPVTAIIAPKSNLIVAGDERGGLHWLEIVD